MKQYLIIICLSVLIFGCQNSSENIEPLKLWYDKPAEKWVEALPIGNGRLGAMVFGDPALEKIQLNEATVWAGQPNRNDNPAAKNELANVRKLIFDGKLKEAQNIVNEKFISKKSNGMPYQTVGNVQLLFPNHELFTDYYRDLNIEKAVATTRYKIDDVVYTRETFASAPDQMIVMRIFANKPGKVSFSLSMSRPADVEIKTEGNNELVMSGVTSDFEQVQGAVKFQARAKVLNISGNTVDKDSSIWVENADTALIYVSIATNFNDYNDISGNEEQRVKSYLSKINNKTYTQIFDDHISDYQKYFNRVKIDLGETESVKNTTDLRIKNFAKSNDPQLVSLYFQYGRYLLISSSRPGGQPANLQGLWNDQLFPAWDSKYTVNINTEMNYWPSEPTNLAEMNDPLIKMVKELSETGRKTAMDMYGAEGWVLHHNTDLWRINGPVDGAFWGMWPMGGAWLCQHLYEKYEYNGNKEYLKSVYPILKGAVEFYLSFLIEEPNNNWLVVSPSNSPENAPSIHPGESISYGTTMDNQLLFDLFSKTIKSAKILNTDDEFITKIEEALKRLPPMQIGQYSQLQEWIEDVDNPTDNHRHVSHLYGVFPSNQISAFRTPELFDAARTSLVHRGDPSTGWSMNWKINLWASFLDGDHAFKLITDQIKLVDGSYRSGGTYPNMFDAHPPFQIDGNFGFTSGVIEMLMQSKDGAIFILPALPKAWPNGSIKGLRARGGFLIKELEWKNYNVSKLIIESTIGGNCRIRSFSKLEKVHGDELKPAEGLNSNPFYEVPVIKAPIISDKANLNNLDLKTSYLYDINTKAGDQIIILGDE